MCDACAWGSSMSGCSYPNEERTNLRTETVQGLYECLESACCWAERRMLGSLAWDGIYLWGMLPISAEAQRPGSLLTQRWHGRHLYFFRSLKQIQRSTIPIYYRYFPQMMNIITFSGLSHYLLYEFLNFLERDGNVILRRLLSKESRTISPVSSLIFPHCCLLSYLVDNVCKAKFRFLSFDELLISLGLESREIWKSREKNSA